jgi:hypothetical protein
MRTGRYLVIASAVCTTVVLFNVRLQSTSLVPIDFGSRIDVLPMLLSLGVLLLLVSFSLRAGTDVLLDREAAVLVTRYVENERVKAAEKAARETDDSIADGQREHEEGPSEPDPWWEPYVAIREAADLAVLKAETRIGVRRWPRRIRRLRSVLEILVPISFAAIALTLSRSSLHTFVTTLMSAFKI